MNPSQGRNRLTSHNRLWRQYWDRWCNQAGAPWWGEGTVLTPELRGRYEIWLPWREFSASLAQVARNMLPLLIEEADADWVPKPLRCAAQIASLPDFWQMLPVSLAGRVLFEEQELLPLFCALADPPRFGTDAGRYPEQFSFFQRWCTEQCRPLHLLDIGCGVGLNTWELAAAAANSPAGLVQMTGITAEPLEVWMAFHRKLPHDPVRTAHFSCYDSGLPVSFQVGTAENFPLPKEPADAVFCNGLMGGRFFCAISQYRAFLERCRRALRSGGMLFCADHFHQGMQDHKREFFRLAAEMGFARIADADTPCWQMEKQPNIGG